MYIIRREVTYEDNSKAIDYFKHRGIFVTLTAHKEDAARFAAYDEAAAIVRSLDRHIPRERWYVEKEDTDGEEHQN